MNSGEMTVDGFFSSLSKQALMMMSSPILFSLDLLELHSVLSTTVPAQQRETFLS